jgi:hypothetical protein
MVTDKFLCAAALYQYRALRSLTAAGYQPHDPRGLLMRPWNRIAPVASSVM